MGISAMEIFVFEKRLTIQHILMSISAMEIFVLKKGSVFNQLEKSKI